MGMVSSAVYRYFPSRDDLLTALIIDGYNALGAAAEDAGAACRRDDEAGRWLAACRAVRDWALAHRHEYSLDYGSPVPGYQAPEQTAAATTCGRRRPGGRPGPGPGSARDAGRRPGVR
jgi:AcrR family transcriptional regulator